MAGIRVKQDISAIVQRSDLIIRGKVISTESQRKEDFRGRHNYTTVTVQILDTISGNIKGNIEDSTLSFEVVGGTVDGRVEVVSHTPVFEIDEDAIVFLEGDQRAVQLNTVKKILVYDEGVYWDDREITVESFLGALRSLGQNSRATISLEEKRQATAAGVTDKPILTNISFDKALNATCEQVTITGTNFGSTQDSGKVEIINKNKQQKIRGSVLSWSDTQIVCTVPTNLSGGSSLVTVSTNDGTGDYVLLAADCYILDKKWIGTSPVVPYKINENTSDCSGEGAAVQSAAGTWNDVGSDFTFSYAGSHSRTYPSDDGNNDIMWGTLPSDILGITTIYFWTGQPIDGADIVFNDYYTWSTKSTPYSWEIDVESIALHELGHWPSLDDLYDDADSDKVMYYQSEEGHVARQLHQCDKDGICAHWGPCPTFCSITVTSPTSSSNWATGTSHTVMWNSSSNPSSYVKIELYEGGFYYVTFTTSTPDDGSYTLTVPSYLLEGCDDYHFRVSSSSDSSCYGESDTFCVILSPPNVPTGVSASDETYCDRVQVSWTASSGATSYEIWRYTSNNSGSASKIADDTASPYDDTSAVAGTTYWYWVKAKNSGGTSGFSSPDSGYTGTTPSTPTGVSATDGTYCDRVQVSWSASSGATSYEIWRYTSNNSGSASKIADDTASPYDDTSAVAGTTYWYWVKAKNSCGTSGFSSPDSGYTGTTPSTPTGVSATDGTYTDKVPVSWSASSGATSYEIWRYTSNNSGSASKIADDSSSPYDDTSAVAGTTYWYWVKANNSCGTSGFSDGDSGYCFITPPDPPVVHAEPNMTPGLCNKISWDTVPEAKDYYAECSSDPNFLVVDYNSGWIARTYYQFCGLTGCQEYWYRVKSGLSAWSQTSQAEFQSDTLINTASTSSGDVILSGGSGTLVVDTVGSTSSSIVVGYLNSILITTETILTQIEVYLNISTSVSIEFVVYEGGSLYSDSYNRIHSSTLAGSGTGTKFYSSDSISVPLEAGKHYLIGAVWSGSAVIYYNSCSAHSSPSFGGHVGYASCSFPSPSTRTAVSSNCTFYHRYTTVPYSSGYDSPGSIASTAIDLPIDGSWNVVDFNTTTPIDTALTVDILPAAGLIPIPGYEDVSVGFDLSGISDLTIRLRANLSTNDPNGTPALHDWSVTYADPAGIESVWSNIESSIQVTLGDFEPDCDVDLDDLAVLTEQWLLEKLLADVWPDGGDGIINLPDLAVFANAWQSMPSSPNWNPKCDIAPQGGDGIVDIGDLAVFTEQWLQFGAYCADIAPLPEGDGTVNFLDFAEFASHWLEGT
jgi:hypothetical protein